MKVGGMFGRISGVLTLDVRRISGALCSALLLLVLCPGPVRSQAINVDDPRQALTQYRIDGWQTEQGLPLNTVQALLQTRDGYLWVGTGGGLSRFDGVRFATFESSSVPELASRSIFGFLEDSKGNLWVGHAEGAAIYRDRRFQAVFGREVTDGRRVWAFAESKDGSIWIATENGLVHWKDGLKKIYRLADGLPSERLRSVALDRDGLLWIGSTGAGLISFDGEQFKTFTPENGFPHVAVRSVLADPAGGVWAATAGGGLALVRDGKITTWSVKEGLPTDQLVSLSRDANGALWIGTWGGGIARMRDGEFTSISTAGGLAGGQIWTVYADREGSIWVGTWVGGLNRLRTRDFVVLGSPEGLSHDNIRSVIHARNGVTWVTTAGGGVNKIENGKITALGSKDGLASDETSCLLEDRDGAIWIGTYTHGVSRVKDGRIENYGAKEGFRSLDIRSLYQDRAGTIWVGTMSGLAQFNGTGFTHIQQAGAPLEGVSTILQDRTGTLWFGTGEGLFQYRDGLFKTLTRKDGLLSNWIMDLYEDADGSIWIGTNGEGMNRLRNGKLSSIPPSAGLWDSMAQVILEDRLGNLWMTCNRGFFRVARSELNAFVEGRVSKVSSIGYGPGDALRSTTFAGGHQPAGAVDVAGHLWLPSFRGLVMVDPANLPGSGDPPEVHLEEVTVNGVEVDAKTEIVLPPGSVPVSIRYTTTSLRDAGRVRFRYRMEGANFEWVDAGRRREAFFPALPHGHYTFRLAASVDGTTWREATSPLSIRVKRRFFQTPWFYALITLAILAVIAAVMRLRTRSLRRQKAEMEREVKEKTEELRQANEHLGRLSFVDSLTGLANRRRFDEALHQEWERAKRFRTPLAVIIADVDRFKNYNDTLGHPEGDRCLAAVADVLLHAGRRAGDVVARYGGEEFVVLIPGADFEAATTFAEGLRRACEARALPHPASSVGPVVTISLGVSARVPSGGESSEALVQEADAALYRAKREGRNRVSGDRDTSRFATSGT